MEKFDLIGQLCRKAYTNGWVFTAGDEFYKNIELADSEMNDGQLILTAQFNATPTFVRSKIPSITYIGSIMLGRKFDNDGTPASLDEDYMDKYNRRLLELMQLLATFLGEFQCENDLDITSVEFIQDINRFDTNIDFVGGNITFEQ